MTRQRVLALAGVGDDQLDSVPTAGTVRFANGERTLEQVIAAALKHQQQQLDALKAAVAHSDRTNLAQTARMLIIENRRMQLTIETAPGAAKPELESTLQHQLA